LERGIDALILEKMEFSMKKTLNVQWEKLIQAICGEMASLVEGALVAFDPHQAMNSKDKKLKGTTSRKEILKMGLLKIADRLHLWNQRQQSKRIERQESPETLISFLFQVYALTKAHFNPLNAVLEAKMCTLLLKEALSFCNRHALRCMMHYPTRYCNKSAGISIRMNVSEVEFWLQEAFFTSDPKVHSFLQSSLAPLSCICQYLQIWPGDQDFVSFCREHEMHKDLLWEMERNFDIQPTAAHLQVHDLTDLKERFLVTRQLHSLFYPKQ
jgi:hypothetical protein